MDVLVFAPKFGSIWLEDAEWTTCKECELNGDGKEYVTGEYRRYNEPPETLHFPKKWIKKVEGEK